MGLKDTNMLLNPGGKESTFKLVSHISLTDAIDVPINSENWWNLWSNPRTKCEKTQTY